MLWEDLRQVRIIAADAHNAVTTAGSFVAQRAAAFVATANRPHG